ncbi:hypothetical protein PDIDSM_2077 [Penicillium digitatum]|nr:hypothetical protein PDIDSM_2077 [Penicillium digitatum]
MPPIRTQSSQNSIEHEAPELNSGRPGPEQTATTEEPPATTEEPPATAEEPPATTEDPPATTEEPPATAEEPPATTEDPPATTEDPPATTEELPVTLNQREEEFPSYAMLDSGAEGKRFVDQEWARENGLTLIPSLPHDPVKPRPNPDPTQSGLGFGSNPSTQ